MAAWRVRAARCDDYEALLALYDELDAMHRAARPDLFRAPEGPARAVSEVAALVAGPESAILVVEGDVGLEGMAVVMLRRVPSSPVREAHVVGEIDNLVVAHGARRRGFGRALLEAAATWARGLGAVRLVLSVWAFNEEAVMFYEAEGFAAMQWRMSREI